MKPSGMFFFKFEGFFEYALRHTELLDISRDNLMLDAKGAVLIDFREQIIRKEDGDTIRLYDRGYSDMTVEFVGDMAKAINEISSENPVFMKFLLANFADCNPKLAEAILENIYKR